MSRLVCRRCRSLVLAAFVAMPAGAFSEIVEVTVTGEGLTEETARHDALQKALKWGGSDQISSRSDVENFKLIRDTIYARAEGIVTDFRILETGDRAGGSKYCKIVAKVSGSNIASAWDDVRDVLDQIGRPAIAVYVRERIGGVVQDSSILGSQIELRLLDAGFLVIGSQQVRDMADKQSVHAGLEQNISKVQEIARSFAAPIFITGSAHASAAGVRALAGRPTAMYNGDAMIKMYDTETAELLGRDSMANWAGGAHGFRDASPQAGKKALEHAVRELVERCCRRALKHWAEPIGARGELILQVEGMDIIDAIRLKKKLLAIHPDKIQYVYRSMTKDAAKLRIRAEMTAGALAAHLVEGDWPALIEIVDVIGNRIHAKKVGRQPRHRRGG